MTYTALLAAAVEYCNEHKCGGRIAVKDPEFEGKLTYHQIDYARAYPDTDRNKYDVLTAKELIALKTWIRASEAKNNGRSPICYHNRPFCYHGILSVF